MRKEKIQKKKKRRKGLFFAVLTIALISACVIKITAYEDNEVYNNEKQFRKFADSQFETAQALELSINNKSYYKYGEPISYAVDYSECDDERIAAFRHKTISEIMQKFETEIEGDIEYATGTEATNVDLIKKHALILKSGIFESDNGIINLAIYEKGSVEDGKEMKTTHTVVHTYQFSKKTGDILVPPQIFKTNYRKHCSDYFIEYFRSYYTEDQLTDQWEQYLAPTEDNFNKYIVTQNGVTFFFDEGTILNSSEGEVYAGITSLHSEEILRDKIIQRYIDPDKPMVAITYDDGPGGSSEDRILNCLEYNNVVATFFYQGYRVAGNEEKIKRAQSIGCEIGHHTWNHPVLTSLNSSELSKQLNNTSNAIYNACGQYPTVFRPSYGITDSKINKMSGMPVIMWSIDTVDWESRNGNKVFSLVKKSGNLDGKIILMHSIHDSTADATEMMVPWLKEQGYQLVTVSELIKYKTGSEPVPGKTYR